MAQRGHYPLCLAIFRGIVQGMTWETPELIEIRMDAEIGAYQGDDGDTRPAPQVEATPTDDE